eukprot:TRINITY_DN91897_c0_g1_i1.p1 TRINITY_DN91897_c0_g1~~TRINITY_DN91897_c0_g1_i1.p1  ORF type:complete len:510 (+),score=88.17 TRINITY_DN91897_c0_g1_i1:79-1608(+)
MISNSGRGRKEVTEDAESIMNTFKVFDEDRSGAIEKGELVAVLRRLSLETVDIDELIEAVDVNRDGVVDYEEFVSWVCDPSLAHPVLQEDGYFDTFDFKTALEPMFRCFDRNSDGSISKREFLESYQIMVSCLRMHPGCAGRKDVLDYNAQRQLKLIDGNGDKRVSFDEFLRWQKTLISKSRIPTFQLPVLFEELATSLSIIFEISSTSESGESELDGTLQALQKSISDVADTSRQLYKPEPASVDYGSLWQAAPSAFVMRQLMSLCSKTKGIVLSSCRSEHQSRDAAEALRKRSRASMRRAVSFAVGRILFCIPDPNSTEGNPRWLAQIVKAQSQSSEDIFFYELVDGDTWRELLADEDVAGVQAAFAAMPQAMRLFALLKGHGNMARDMSWFDVEDALERAVSWELLPAIAKLSFEGFILRQVEDHLLEAKSKGVADYQFADLKAAASRKREQLRFTAAGVIKLLSLYKLYNLRDDMWLNILRAGSAAETEEGEPLRIPEFVSLAGM